MSSKSTCNTSTTRYPSVIDGNNGSAVKKLMTATMGIPGRNDGQTRKPGIMRNVTHELYKNSTNTLFSTSNSNKKRKSDEKLENSLIKKHKLQHNGQHQGTSMKKPLADITGKHTSAKNSSTTASKSHINTTLQKASSTLGLKSSKVVSTSGSCHPPTQPSNGEVNLKSNGMPSFSMKSSTIKILATVPAATKSKQNPLVSKTAQLMPPSASRNNITKHSSNDGSTTAIVKTSPDTPVKDEIQASTSAATDTASSTKQIPDGNKRNQDMSIISNNGISSMNLEKDDSLVELLKKTIHEQESLLQQQMIEINTLKQVELEMKTKLLGMEEELDKLRKCCRFDDELNKKSTPVIQQQVGTIDTTIAHNLGAAFSISEGEKICNENVSNNANIVHDNLILTNSPPKLTNIAVLNGAPSTDIADVVEHAILTTGDISNNVLVDNNVIMEEPHASDTYVSNNEKIGITDQVDEPKDDQKPHICESNSLILGLSSPGEVHQISSSRKNNVEDTALLETYSESLVVVKASTDNKSNDCDRELLPYSSKETHSDTGTMSLLTTTIPTMTKPVITPLNLLSVVKAEETIDFENSKLFSDDETGVPPYNNDSSAVKCRRTPIKTRPNKRALRKQQQQQQETTTANESENIKEE